MRRCRRCRGICRLLVCDDLTGCRNDNTDIAQRIGSQLRVSSHQSHRTQHQQKAASKNSYQRAPTPTQHSPPSPAATTPASSHKSNTSYRKSSSSTLTRSSPPSLIHNETTMFSVCALLLLRAWRATSLCSNLCHTSFSSSPKRSPIAPAKSSSCKR